MLFNSYIFVLAFLPLCVCGYFLLNHYKRYTLAQLFLFGMSLWFYGYYNPWYLLIILSSIVINYGVYLVMGRLRAQSCRRAAMVLGVVINIGILIYFKYMDFLIGNVNALTNRDIGLLHIALPLGISFFTFQQISFIVDAYRGEVPKYGFLFYACYVSYFPQLIAGPIVTHDELIPQFLDPAKKSPNAGNLAKGIYIFSMGLAKKVLLADTLGRIVSHGYETLDYLNSASAIITILAYTFQIYFDFSGYCDMATGVGRMMNIDLPQNFNSPYKALTITDFWDRWHMTLTRFFTKYVYIPLGGSRRGTVRTCLNVMLVFLISGLWHGASWNFVLWGGMHGVFAVVTRVFRRFFDKLHPALNWLTTFVFVNVAWVFFKADSFTQAFTLLNKAAEWNFNGFDQTFFEVVRSAEITELLELFSLETVYPPLVLTALLLFSFIAVLGCKNSREKMQNFCPTVFNLGTTLLLLLWSVFSFTGISTFLYFNF